MTMEKREYLNYINGKWVSTENRFAKLNPYTGESLGEVAASEAMDVIPALAFAKKAQQAFEKTSLPQRAQLLRDLAQALEVNADDYALREAWHQGLSVTFVKEKSIQASIEALRRAAEDCVRQESGAAFVQAVGVVSLITSWCLSLRLICERLAPALAAGNAVLIKVSELSPVTGVILAEVLEKANCPTGLVQIFQGRGPQVGALLAAHPAIRAVSFVGKTTQSESLIKSAVSQNKKIQLSLGAKNSALVLSDVPVETLVPQIAKSFLMGQGQMCWNTHRLFVTEQNSKNLLEALKNELETLQPATSPVSSSAWTPLIDARACELNLEKTQAARNEHAKIIFGGKSISAPGFFVQPTFTQDLTNCSVLQQDELSTSLFITTTVKYAHEMVKWSNTGYFGHSAVVWGVQEKAEKIALGLQVAQVWINGWMLENSPVLGQKQSAFGNLDLRAFGNFFSDVKKMTFAQPSP